MQVHMPYTQGMYVTEASNSKEPLPFSGEYCNVDLNI